MRSSSSGVLDGRRQSELGGRREAKGTRDSTSASAASVLEGGGGSTRGGGRDSVKGRDEGDTRSAGSALESKQAGGLPFLDAKPKFLSKEKDEKSIKYVEKPKLSKKEASKRTEPEDEDEESSEKLKNPEANKRSSSQSREKDPYLNLFTLQRSKNPENSGKKPTKSKHRSPSPTETSSISSVQSVSSTSEESTPPKQKQSLPKPKPIAKPPPKPKKDSESDAESSSIQSLSPSSESQASLTVSSDDDDRGRSRRSAKATKKGQIFRRDRPKSIGERHEDLEKALEEERRLRKKAEEERDRFHAMLKDMEGKTGEVGSETRRLQAEVKEAEAKFAEERVRILEKHSDEKAALEQAHDAALSELKVESKIESDRLLAEQKDSIFESKKVEIDKLKIEHEHIVSGLKAKHLEEMAKVISNAEATRQLESLATRMDQSTIFVDSIQKKISGEYLQNLKVSLFFYYK
ncbi:hypothetical protein HDU67_002452 [Dinochytrium kinnereticum]|nr:hypothetical protein HDU67_002452 [Dinochytrium kinnereticum]